MRNYTKFGILGIFILLMSIASSPVFGYEGAYREDISTLAVGVQIKLILLVRKLL